MTLRIVGVLCAGFVAAACGSVDPGPGNPDASPTDTNTVEPTPQPTPDPKLSGELSILTYNVHGLPALITGDDTAARYQLIAPLLEGFDVVGVQEDFMDANHDVLATTSTHETLVRFADITQGRVYGSGLTVMADLTEVEHQHTLYTDCNGVFDSGTDCLASKGFQVLRLELAPGIEVDLYNTHLDAGGSPDDDAARASQLQQMIDSMTTYSAERAVIFTGDTNLEYDDADEGPMLESFLVDAALSDSCLDVGCPETDHIDRILLRSSDTVRLSALEWFNEPDFYDQNGTPMSDHPAISIRLLWEEQ